jgi:hypothetical protein
VSTCAHCGGELPESATFCPSCGRRTNAPVERDVPIDVQHAEPRYFGLAPPVLVFAAAVALLVLGVVLLLADAFALGVISIVVGFCLLPTFLAGARRWPDTRLAQVGVSTAERLRGEAEVAADSITTWSRASREVARLRKEQFQLRRERDAKIREFGAAAYADDASAEELKAAAKELDERIAENDRKLQRTIAGARRRHRKGRASVVSTEVIEAEENPLVAAPEPDAPDDVSQADPDAADEPLAREEPELEPVPAAKPARKRQTRSR